MTDRSPALTRPHGSTWLHWGLVAAWALVVVVLLWTPGPEGPAPWDWLERFRDAGGDKLVHAGLFAVQTWLLCRCPPGAGDRRWLGVCVALAVAFGVVTELGQLVAAGRDATVGDGLADAAGAAVAALFSGWRERGSW